MGSEPTVYVVDHDAEVCKSLRRLIESGGLRVATHASAKEFLEDYDSETPGCLVLDIRIPAYRGLNLLQRFVVEGLGLPVIILTGRSDSRTAVQSPQTRTLLGALDDTKEPFDDRALLDRVRRAIEWDIRNRVERVERAKIVARLALLTPREREVLDRVVGGRANRQIAKELGISTKTVEAHRAHVMKKLRADSLAGLVQLVQSAGINGRHV